MIKYLKSLLKAHKKEFDRNVDNDSLMGSVSLLLIALVAKTTHMFDLLLGMDGILDKKRPKNDPFSAPIGTFFGFIAAISGYIIGALLRIITIIPSIFGSIVDNVISRIIPSYRDLMAPVAKKLEKADFGIPEPMFGFFGFVLGILPELVVNVFNLAAGIVYTVVMSATDSISDGLRSIGNFIFGSKKAEVILMQNGSSSPSSTLSAHQQLSNGDKNDARQALTACTTLLHTNDVTPQSDDEHSPTKTDELELSDVDLTDEYPSSLKSGK
jgi:hypothetical protein